MQNAINPARTTAIGAQKARFVELPEELFQLNQPELDFGLYRIVHARQRDPRLHAKRAGHCYRRRPWSPGQPDSAQHAASRPAEGAGQPVRRRGAGGGIELPFGGVKQSGHGRERGFEALYGFSALKTLALNPVAGETPLLKRLMGEATPELRAKFLSTIRIGRFSQPEDLGHAACLQCSDEASMITGVCMEVDGGRCF